MNVCRYAGAAWTVLLGVDSDLDRSVRQRRFTPHQREQERGDARGERPRLHCTGATCQTTNRSEPPTRRKSKRDFSESATAFPRGLPSRPYGRTRCGSTTTAVARANDGSSATEVILNAS